MFFKFTVKEGTSFAEIKKLATKLNDTQRLNKAVGIGFEKTLRRHFRNLDKRPNRRGWRKQHFWQKIAVDTVFTHATEDTAIVTIANTSGRKFGAKVFGATIRPKSGKKFLAIPAKEARYGKSPSALDEELDFRRTRKGGILGRLNADGTFDVHYWLVRKANVPRDADALPKTETVVADAKKTISLYLKTK